MASDGLLYTVFKRINKRTQTPIYSTLLSGLLAAFLALILDVQQLIDMMSLGTLMAYTIVAACVVLLRYQNDDTSYIEKVPATSSQIFRQIFNLNLLKRPNHLSSNIVKFYLFMFALFTPVCCILIDTSRNSQHWFVYTGLSVSWVALLIAMLIIVRQPKNQCDLSIKVPGVPLLPLISIFINIYLMCQLDYKTWIRFFTWMIIGYSIYFTYGVRQSIEGNRQKLELSEHGRACAHNLRTINNNNTTVQTIII